MSLLDLSWRNVRRNFKIYSIYLISMIIGVIIQFTFSSLIFNEDILTSLENTETFQLGLITASIVVFLFIIFFILYANSFFMNQRKKEFGMYLLYGMSERQIALMVFTETVFLSVISLVSGILVGGLLSRFFGMLLMNLMQYDDVISFAFPIEAIGATVLLFIVLIVIISIQSYLSVRRMQLVELFHSAAKPEKPRQFNMPFALLSILLLGLAFFLITRDGDSVFWEDYLAASLIAVSVGIIGGTYLFFRQFLGWLLNAIMNRKKFLEGDKVLWMSSLRFTMQNNTLNQTFISLFSAVLILLVGFVSLNYAFQFNNIIKFTPNHIAYESVNEQKQTEIDNIIQTSNHTVTGQMQIEGIYVSPLTERNVAFGNPDYFSENLLLFSEEQFNDMIALRDDEGTVDLNDQEAIVLSEGFGPFDTFTEGGKSDFTVQLEEYTTTFNLVERRDYALLGAPEHPLVIDRVKPAIFIISDEAYNRIPNPNVESYEIYQIEDARNSTVLSEEVQNIAVESPESYYSAFADVYAIQIESSSLILFSAAFLAVIALFALGSVIYFKQLREATDEQKQYAILRKIGMENHEMKRVIRKQLLFVFIPPLLLGMLISWIIMNYTFLDEVRELPQLTSIIWAIYGSYFVIYVLFYLSSVTAYYKIANQIN